VIHYLIYKLKATCYAIDLLAGSLSCSNLSLVYISLSTLVIFLKL